MTDLKAKDQTGQQTSKGCQSEPGRIEPLGSSLLKERAAAAGTARERRRDPFLVKCLGIDPAELDAPFEAMLSAGVQKLWAVNAAMNVPVEEPDEAFESVPGEGEEDAAMRRAEFDFDERQRARQRDEREQQQAEEACRRPPIWRALTGLFRDQERRESPEVRERKLQGLMDVVMKLLRHELGAEKEKKNPYHTVMWDPLEKICMHLGIARAQLSRLSKEATGLAAHELLDGIHAEGIKATMKEDARRFVAKISAAKASSTSGGGQRARMTAMEVWRELKQARRGPQFQRTAWAISFGIPNYMRFYRACLFYYHMAPQQLEYEAIAEVLAESRDADASEEAVAEVAEKTTRETWAAEPIVLRLRPQQVHFFTERERKVSGF